MCGENPRRCEVELGIGGDGIQDSLVADFCRHREVVKTGAEFVAKFDDLGGEIISIWI